MKKNKISDDKWFEMLLKSVNNRKVEGFEFPGFPDDELQKQFVGSSNESAMIEGFEFFKVLKGYSAALGKPFNNTTKVLDFGCGWGRFLRIFTNYITDENLYGVDIDPFIIEECHKNQVPGNISRIFPNGNLPYPDNFFDCVMSYSVFTHLPEYIHNNWIKEIARVSKPGCVFVLTLESIRFLDFVENLGNSKPDTDWHKGLSKFSNNIPNYRNLFNDGKFVYLPTGGGDFRSSDVYGDAVVSTKYIERAWGDLFNIIEYIDEPARFWQAVLVTQRA
jgi:SAM-dependent methyltransferase